MIILVSFYLLVGSVYLQEIPGQPSTTRPVRFNYGEPILINSTVDHYDNVQISSGNHPPTTNTRPLTTNTRPLTTNTRPLTTNTRPLTTNTRPLMTNTRPLTTNTRTLTTNTRPLMTNTRPLTTNTRPLTTNTRPLTTNTRPLTTNTRPLTTNTRPQETFPTPAPLPHHIPVPQQDSSLFLHPEFKKLHDKLRTYTADFVLRTPHRTISVTESRTPAPGIFYSDGSKHIGTNFQITHSIH